MTLKEVAQILHINPEVLRRWLRNGKLPGFKVGSDWRVRQEDLNQFLSGTSEKISEAATPLTVEKPKMCFRFPKWLEYSGLPAKLNQEIGHEAWPIFKKLIEIDYESKNRGDRRVFYLEADLALRVGYSSNLVKNILQGLQKEGYISLGKTPQGPYAQVVTPLKTPRLVLDIEFSKGGVKDAPQKALENDCLRRYLEMPEQ